MTLVNVDRDECQAIAAGLRRTMSLLDAGADLSLVAVAVRALARRARTAGDSDSARIADRLLATIEQTAAYRTAVARRARGGSAHNPEGD